MWTKGGRPAPTVRPGPRRTPGQRRARRLVGLLAALICVLPAAPLARLLTRAESFPGLAAAAGFALALGAYRLAAGRLSAAGLCAAALLTPAAVLPGLWYGWGELILRDNEPYGCTLEEALELVPVVALDPFNRVRLLWTLGGVLAMDLLCALLTARYLRLRREEEANKREKV